MQKCPCNTDHLYKECCYPFHIEEKSPKTPLELMKSRYSAYALQLEGYIIDTTHPENPRYEKDRVNWELSIEKFSQETLFLRLEILEHTHEGNEGYVAFRAFLERKGEDTSFEERSKFIFENNQWYYLNGEPKSFKR